MVKPHSPIAECKRSPHLTRGRDKQKDSRPDPRMTRAVAAAFGCDGERILIPRPSERKDKVLVSPRSARSSSTGKQKRTGMVVTFSRIVNVKWVLHGNDMSEKVRARYWMTEEEHQEIKTECRQTILKMMRNDEAIDAQDSDFCSRGLEMRTKQGQKDKCTRKEAVKRAVLLQQHLQRAEGIIDCEFLAVVSSVKTKASAEAAYETALRDAEEARLYYRLHANS